MADTNNVSPAPFTDQRLDEDITDEKQNSFKGATLQLSGGNDVPNVEFAGTDATPSADADGLNRNRPGSTIGRASTSSSGSHTARSNSVRRADSNEKSYFCNKSGFFENCVMHCRRDILKSDLDGDVRGAWLLTEIDHWDNEREKVVILCDTSVLIVRYDFITQKINGHQRILLHMVETVQIGNFIYPANSIMPPRDHGGIRICWGNLQNLSIGQKWNPFSSDIPYLTLAHHKLIYSDKERETVTYNVDDFYESLVQAITQVLKTKSPHKKLTIEQGSILIESYASITSMVFNQSHLGFNRDRQGLSF